MLYIYFFLHIIYFIIVLIKRLVDLLGSRVQFNRCEYKYIQHYCMSKSEKL